MVRQGMFSPSSPPEPGDQTDLLSERVEKIAQCTEPKTGALVGFCGVFGSVHVEEGLFKTYDRWDLNGDAEEVMYQIRRDDSQLEVCSCSHLHGLA
jgi:hypothetical protein